MLVKEYCKTCDHYMEIIPVMKSGIIEWICSKCGTLIDEDYEDEMYDY